MISRDKEEDERVGRNKPISIREREEIFSVWDQNSLKQL